MCLLNLEKKSNALVRVFEVFHYTRGQDQFQHPVIFLSTVSKLKLLQYLYTTSKVSKNEGLFIQLLGCHCWCFMINDKNHNKWRGFLTRKILYILLQNIG